VNRKITCINFLCYRLMNIQRNWKDYMEVIEDRHITGVFEIRLPARHDERGFFMRVYDEEIFKKNGLYRHWVQENHSRSEKKGIIRGLHFQFPPWAETKLIRCIRGAIFDVFVDLRRDSSQFGKWGSVELSEKKHNMVYIPRGFAHGFCTLSDESEVVYKVDNMYAPQAESGLLWNDPDLAIQWPVEHPLLSEKDAHNLILKEFIQKHKYIELKDQT
jgi:dTDP-4-dehydrorhamnose 3,5-epimerase